MNSPRFVVRTVRQGTVVIAGRTFRPDENFLAYDGRLDGMRFAFGRYHSGDDWLPFVQLWGTEAAFIGVSSGIPGPEVVDGTLPWVWWQSP